MLPQVINKNICHVYIECLLNIKFLDCCVIERNSWAETVWWTAALSIADFEAELLALGKSEKPGRSIR